MAVEKTLDKEIQSYLPKLNTEQKMALLGVLRRITSVDEAAWNERTFTREMNRRLKELKTGEVTGLTLQMLEDGARNAYRSKKKK
jgi:hypothetical protein